MMKLPHLEDAFNAVLMAMEKIPGVNYSQINPEEIEGQTLLAIAGWIRFLSPPPSVSPYFHQKLVRK
jgi:hypothetical protein